MVQCFGLDVTAASFAAALLPLAALTAMRVLNVPWQSG